ncbi:MAG: hypothetical protein F4X11_20230 [Acidobacteria bacterium]|nr:hypothetical protein [Acidobacteriota bacterium]
MRYSPSVTKPRLNRRIRYEPDDPCPPLVTAGVAFQGVVLILANTVLMVTIIVRAAGEGELYLGWAVFAALVIAGVTTALQAAHVGRVGAGHILMTGAGPHFIAISVVALTEADLATLASLIVVSSLFQFAMAAWLPFLRRIVTPIVSGTALMLIAVAVMPIAVGRLTDVPSGAPEGGGLIAAGVTLAVATGMVLRASGVWRLWAPLSGILAGCAAALFFGMYDLRPVAEASWLDVPDVAAWPGIDFTPDARFWALLPVFAIVSVVAAIKTSSDGAVIQQASARQPRATDFRLVQGALNASGVGILLSGLAVTPPVIIYLPSSVSLINLTGVAARSVGYAIGGTLFALAFLPKLTAVLLAVPSPVMGAFLLIIMGLLFVEGIRTVFQDGLDPQKGLVVGVALALGVGLESGSVFESVLGPTWSASLGNGMTIGVLATVLLTAFLELTSPRRRRLDVELDASAASGIDAFLREIAGRSGWNAASGGRLRGAGEEALECLLQLRGEQAAGAAPRLILFARPGRETVEMEFLVVSERENIEDHLTYLSERAETPEESELSFRLLRHYASSVRHRQYHGIEIVTVKVAGSR